MEGNEIGVLAVWFTSEIFQEFPTYISEHAKYHIICATLNKHLLNYTWSFQTSQSKDLTHIYNITYLEPVKFKSNRTKKYNNLSQNYRLQVKS